jgi:hypothetical protein
MFIVIQAVLLALSGLFIKNVGATAAGAVGAAGGAVVRLPAGAGVAGVAAGFPQAARTSANSSGTTPAIQSLCVRIGNTFLSGESSLP